MQRCVIVSKQISLYTILHLNTLYTKRLRMIKPNIKIKKNVLLQAFRTMATAKTMTEVYEENFKQGSLGAVGCHGDPR